MSSPFEKCRSSATACLAVCPPFGCHQRRYVIPFQRKDQAQSDAGCPGALCSITRAIRYLNPAIAIGIVRATFFHCDRGCPRPLGRPSPAVASISCRSQGNAGIAAPSSCATAAAAFSVAPIQCGLFRRRSGWVVPGCSPSAICVDGHGSIGVLGEGVAGQQGYRSKDSGGLCEQLPDTHLCLRPCT